MVWGLTPGVGDRLEEIGLDGAGPGPFAEGGEGEFVDGDEDDARIGGRVEGGADLEALVDGHVLDELDKRCFPGEKSDEGKRNERREDVVEAGPDPSGERGWGGWRHGDYHRKKKSRGKLYSGEKGD